MKKLLIPCLCTALTFAAVTNTLAIDNGTWNLSNGLQNGFWQENFAGGGPGQPGNILTGADAAPLDQWLLGFGLTLGSVTPGATPGEYFTTYSGGQVNLQAGPWGDGAVFSPLSAVNHSFSPGSDLQFEIQMTGAIVGEGTGQTIELFAKFDSTAPNSTYQQIAAGNGGHKGSGFQELSVTIHGVPDTGSTLALLGPALIGLVAWRRTR